jgi:hypothetical protein
MRHDRLYVITGDQINTIREAISKFPYATAERIIETLGSLRKYLEPTDSQKLAARKADQNPKIEKIDVNIDKMKVVHPAEIDEARRDADALTRGDVLDIIEDAMDRMAERMQPNIIMDKEAVSIPTVVDVVHTKEPLADDDEEFPLDPSLLPLSNGDLVEPDADGDAMIPYIAPQESKSKKRGRGRPKKNV